MINVIMAGMLEELSQHHLRRINPHEVRFL